MLASRSASSEIDGEAHEPAPSAPTEEVVLGPPIDRAELQLLIEECASAYDAYVQGLQSSEGRDQHGGGIALKPVREAARAIRWAQQNPQDPLASEVLVLIVKHGRFTAEAQQAADTLAREHLDLDADRFNEVAYEVRMWPHPVAERWLSAYLDNSPNRRTKARACWHLAMQHVWLSQRARLEMPPDSDWARDLKKHFGPNSVDYVETIDPSSAAAPATSLLEKWLEEFQSVETDSNFAQAARRSQFELTRLAVGSVVPEIEGEDLNGEPLRMTDHRGKVVVITFWATWCSPCMDMIASERALVERLKDRPFVLLGVNKDEDRAAAKAAMDEHAMTWRSWWDGNSAGDSITDTWNVQLWPTTYVLDHEGIIRYKNVWDEELDDAIDELLKNVPEPAK